VSSVNWSGRKVLVTGAGGFIGSHLCEELARQGASLRALVRYNSRGTYGWLEDSPLKLRRSMEIVQGDLRDPDTVDRLVRACQYVFHLGAIISIPYSYISPTEVMQVNVAGTHNILNACLRHGVQRLLHTSTSEIFGTAQYVPIDEAHPLQAQSPYSASKIAADKLVESYWRSFDVPAVTVRPFNTYGPRQSARAVIPTTIVQILAKQNPKLGSLTPTRDFTYVTDTVAGMIAAMNAPNVVGSNLNFGTGTEIAIADLIALIGELLGTKPLVDRDPSRVRPEKSEVERLLSDNTRARELLKWQPQISLKDGLRSTIAWFESHMDLYRRAIEDYVV
jgi:NAD dependent epimerase/dehydratase